MKNPKLSSPFEDDKTERSAVAILMHWMREIIEKENLDLGFPDVETKGADGKYPDIVIYKSQVSRDILCVIEAKKPDFDVFNESELKEPAHKKAVQRKAPYFATCNFQSLIWFNTERVTRMELVDRHNQYELSDIVNLDDIEEPRFKNPILNELTRFLTELVEVSTGKKPEPLLPIDELLIFYLHRKVYRLARYYTPIIRDTAHKDTQFRHNIDKWFVDQQWQFNPQQDSDYEKVARQTTYLLVNKILFYYALKAKRSELPSLTIPDDLIKGNHLQKFLQGYFNSVLEDINYETVFSTDFIDQLAFPDSKEIVEEIKELLKIVKRYNFANLGYDIIGRIFERLIPTDERYNLGQYFTSTDVVDIILRFCLTHEEDKVLDPSCGTGTFLVRAYQHKKIMNQRLSHPDILETIWGNDIAKFPATLSIINLALQDLSVDKNYPNIIQEDFFNLLTSPEGLELPEKWRKVRAKTLGIEEREITYPRWFDCIVGNPPYTRQEEIPEITETKNYKEKLIKSALYDINDKKIADISKRAGIHTYFFAHGLKFLKDGGRFGFIVSNSWLDVDYGKGLQEFFLNNYKIIAIIESKVERWFADADINTCIVILEKCSDKKERDNNLVHFVYLKKPLSYFIPPAQDKWEEQIDRLNEIDKLKKTILAHNEFYENEELRIFPKSQKELWDEGFASSGETPEVPAITGRTGVPPVQSFTTTKRKLPHWQSPGQVYFITFSAMNEIEFSPEERDIILNSCLFENRKKYILYAVVVMPRHVHMLLQSLPLDQLEEKKGYYNLSEIMHSIKSFTSHKINDIRKRSGSIWLTESYDRIIRTNKEFGEKLQYICENPIKSGLVENLQKYKWFWLPSDEMLEVPEEEQVASRTVGQASRLSSNVQARRLKYQGDLNYQGAKWGKYIRAPQIFFKILEKCKDKLVPLKEVADVRRGFTTGANEFIYLTEEEIKRKKIEREFWMHKDEKSNWVPNYVIKSPRECKSIIVNPKDLKYRVLMIHKGKEKLKGTNILRYIENGERREFDKRPTCKSRKRWYELGKWKPFNIICPQLFNESFRIFNNRNKIYCDCVLMDVNVKNAEIVVSLLNSSYIPLFIELFGRVSLGEGALKLQVDEIVTLLILNPYKWVKYLDLQMRSNLRSIRQ
ncbi:MAG: N-6 DNA methylase [Candidatus Stahlbacteria bacterium]|nr:N-6 DNA methylase [Candidatus Stahlbacteria bacterium]